MAPCLLLLALTHAAWAGPPAAKKPAAPKPLPAPEAARVKTADGWTLAASYRAPRKGRPVVVLAHGMAAGKGEWTGLAEALARRGWGSLALDLRGHGESLQGPRGKVTLELLDATRPWSEAVADIEAAVEFLQAKGIPQGRIGLVGASLGANLVSIAAARRPKLRLAALLSPGRDYRGVTLEEKIGPRTLAAASASDPYAAQTLVGFQARRSRHFLLTTSRGHGAQMLEDPEFLGKLMEWLTR